MDWTLALAAFILGLVLGYVARTLIARNDSGKDNEKKAEQAMLELSQYKQSVADLYQEQGEQLSLLAEQVNKVNQQWNESVRHLHLGDESKPLPQLEQESHSAKDETAKGIVS
ncbi:DUF1043 family protein [Shewanella submarina]|uniref:ZapG family protein n=1 Tax=Shewanella submarina TaxID=2016376 RepID=A0ABV7GAP9_9GAMM|nr:DUF1043 family protein [Shewanella submarina]MCL1038600.1 DUF1043 family protein [Shewanella submarina]